MSTRRKRPATSTRDIKTKKNTTDSTIDDNVNDMKPKPGIKTNNLLLTHPPNPPQPSSLPPLRSHNLSYHHPLLLSSPTASTALLSWFTSISTSRSMPWRKPWLDPSAPDFSGEALSKRAYEVWVSEIMLQQTRVATVIPYFNAWVAKWPTVWDLAGADEAEVLAAWKGLGYYSRATRLRLGAKEVVEEFERGKGEGMEECPIPRGVEGLMGVKGIGRYTAGAISSIAFGEAEPVVDGNVVRVLSRQLGLYVDGKDRRAVELIWEVADGLVKHVAGFPEKGRSETPGLWNQALMELGSTVCTPRPKCGECPIRSTCRVYAEGELLAGKKVKKESVVVPDIEDACSYCEPLDTEDLQSVSPEDDVDDQDAPKPSKKRKTETKPVNTISHYFNLRTPRTKAESEIVDKRDIPEAAPVNGTHKRKDADSSAPLKSTIAYCSLFPKKVVKKKVAEEECVVCLVEARLSGGGSQWLIEQRPATGLLASLWQFPQRTLSTSDNTTSGRKASAVDYVSTLEVGNLDEHADSIQHVGEIGSIVHVFSHLKLTMHVQHFQIRIAVSESLADSEKGTPKRAKWVATEAMDEETLSTGMRRCWDLVTG